MTGLDAHALRARLVTPDGPYAALDVLSSTGSTNADLLAAAEAGAADRTVLIADEQSAGRGRQARTWVSPAGAGLYLSILLRPTTVQQARWSALAMIAGIALLRTAREVGVDATLKWPNDMLIGSAKCAGVLAEVGENGSVVVGIGLNVGPLGEVPVGPGGLAATSLAEAGADPADRTTVAGILLRSFAALDDAWRALAGDVERSGVLAAYREGCGTIGSRVRVELPDGSRPTGVAVDVGPAGELLLRSDDGTESSVSAGDIVHLRAAD